VAEYSRYEVERIGRKAFGCGKNKKKENYAPSIRQMCGDLQARRKYTKTAPEYPDVE